jgi:pyruvate,water dikinase
MELVVDLGMGAAHDASLVGGKALALERLLAASLPCPPAFCVTTDALRLYLDRGGFGATLSQLLDRAPDPAALRELRAIPYAAELPGELEQQVTGALERLRDRASTPKLLAVRSSAVDEDGTASSFAGLHATELGVPASGLTAALRKCWSSIWSDAALAYRRQRGLQPADASMAVVAQALVPAHASAVVFTADPVTGANELLMHVTAGLGPALVDNEVTPDTVTVSKEDFGILRLEVGDKHLRIDTRSCGGVVRTRVAAAGAAATEESLRQLASLALDVEQRFGGGPLDIEAALFDRWYVVQARAITTVTERSRAARLAA